jgi:hypothetical protein
VSAAGEDRFVELPHHAVVVDHQNLGHRLAILGTQDRFARILVLIAWKG